MAKTTTSEPALQSASFAEPPDSEIAQLREQVALLSGRLAAVSDGSEQLIEKQTLMRRIWESEQEKRKGAYTELWYRHDKRKAKLPKWRPKPFWTNKTTPKEVAADYAERTGYAWKGDGPDPHEFKRTPDREVEKEK